MIADIFSGEPQRPVIVAEIGANHLQDLERAKSLVRLAGTSGADAVKFQCFRPDTMTVNVDNEYTRITDGPWAGQTLWQLYEKTYMPWEWHKPLAEIALDMGMEWFSTAYDIEGADYLMAHDPKPAAIKISSFEANDYGLIAYVAKNSDLPLIVSTGLIGDDDLYDYPDHRDMMLMHCVSKYPAIPRDMHLSRIDCLNQLRVFGHIGLSCHSRDDRVSIMATALGVEMIEVHFTDDRGRKTDDSAFSYEPHELLELRNTTEVAWEAMGWEEGFVPSQENSRWARSIFAVKDIECGDEFAVDNIRSLRGAGGKSPTNLPYLIGQRAERSYKKGEPV